MADGRQCCSMHVDESSPVMAIRALGIDIGGTKIAAALVAPDGTMRALHRVPTPVRLRSSKQRLPWAARCWRPREEGRWSLSGWAQLDRSITSGA